jgi:outer membrane biosynthesis protein TonB
MASTSESPKTFDPFEQVTPFFNRAQLFAFSQPPSAEALGRVNRGGSHDYLPQEYVRALLDRFIGPGRWAIRTSLVKTYEEKIAKSGKENLAVTAIVNAELDILSATDPDKKLTYAGIGTHTMEAGFDKGAAAVVGNAITSAESKALKAAAKNLGRAFGSDLKNQLDRSTLPPTIQQYAQQMAERFAASQPALPAPVLRVVESEAQAPAQERTQDEAVRDEAPAPARDEAPRQQRRREEPQEQPRQEERREKVPAERQPNRDPEQRREPEPQPQPAAEPEQKAADVPAQADAPQEQAGGGKQASDAPAPKDWELSMDPGTNFDDWIACLQTMARRINAMNSAKEIENFLKRYKNRVRDLPEIPAEGDRPAKNFKARFRRIVAKRYHDLGLEIPAEFADAAPAPANA